MRKNISAPNVTTLEFEENSILSSILKYGKEIYYDTLGIITENNFLNLDNRLIFGGIKGLIEKNENLSTISLISHIKEIDSEFSADQLKYIIDTPPADKEDITNLARKLKRRSIIKESINLHREALNKLSQMSASESINEIFAVSENTLFSLVKTVSEEEKVIQIGSEVAKIINEFKESPSDTVGLPTPWPQFTESIGGGMRTGVTLIGARPKKGKSTIGQITSCYIASMGIPVLFLDTEMSPKSLIPRIVAHLSEVSIRKIETGTFQYNSLEEISVQESIKKLENIPFYYRSVYGKKSEEILSIIRRWIYTDVGINKQGKANQCLVIWDYFKLMDSSELDTMSEFQVLGFQVSSLTDFCKLYDIPCMAFVQLNRDGVSKEGGDVIAQSDRLLWLCNSFSIFKDKSVPEMEKDGWNNGNRKMITMESRYGGAHEFGNYISMNLKGDISSLIEINNNGHATTQQI